jgi:transposase
MMPRAYSNDLRERVIAACDQGEHAAAVAKRYAVSESFIEKLKRRRRESGSVAAKPHAGGPQPLLAKPGTTLQERRDGLGLAVAFSTLWYHLRRLDLTFKKTLMASAQARPDVRLERACWQALQPLWNPARLVFVDDETGLHTAMVREWGWGPRGERVRGTVIGRPPPRCWRCAMPG